MPRDPNTLSNYTQWKIKHTVTDLSVNFQAQKIHGSVTHIVDNLEDSSQEIILDTSFLDIKTIYIDDNLTEDWEIQDRHEHYGSPLSIKLSNTKQKSQYSIKISFSTKEKCTALQWLTPAQTSNKKHPYVFSQCQAIHCRSLFPCQDTPDTKATYDFFIQSSLPVIVSGIPTTATGNIDDKTEISGADKYGDDDTVFKFEQKIPIPTYLWAIASGDIVSATIGPRSVVAAEPELLAGSRWELERDMEDFIQVAEKLVFPYGMYFLFNLIQSISYADISRTNNWLLLDAQ